MEGSLEQLLSLDPACLDDDARLELLVSLDKLTRRDVWLRPLPHGMAGIWFVHDAIDAHAIMTRIDACAAKSSPDDDRLVGERRADAMAKLILGVDCPEQATQHRRRPTP